MACQRFFDRLVIQMADGAARFAVLRMVTADAAHRCGEDEKRRNGYDSD